MNGCKATIVLTGLLALGACKDDDASSAEGAPAAEAPADGAGGEAAAPGGEGPTAAPTPAPSEPPEPPPSGHAVAKVGSLLFVSSTGEVGFELPPLGEGAEEPVPGMTVNVVGEQDGRLAIETLAAQPAEHHCAGSLDNLEDFRLRLFIGRDDLLPVLTEDYTYEHEDGTKAKLSRGVPVPQGSDELLVGGTPLKLPIPEDRLGFFYEPGAALSSDGSTGKLEPMEGSPLTFAGVPVEEKALFHQGRVLSMFGATPRESGGSLVTVRNPCLELVAIVPQDRMDATFLAGGLDSGSVLGMKTEERGHFLASPYGSAFAVGGDDEDVWGGLTGTEVGEAYGVGGLGLVGTGRSGPTYEVKAGTAIVWADGSPAGQVVADHVFDELPREDGGHTCFDVPIVGPKKGPAIGLCFAPGDVGKHEPSHAGLGLGTIGVGGTGSTGFGTSTGSIFGSTGKKIPRVRQSKAEVAGSLDKDIIRRIVRAHINEVRYCYNTGLTKDPALAGKVSVSFVISPTGSVSSSTVASSTLTDSSVGECIAKAVKRWKFPKPIGGGVVAVKYPFVLEPG